MNVSHRWSQKQPIWHPIEFVRMVELHRDNKIKVGRSDLTPQERETNTTRLLFFLV